MARGSDDDSGQSTAAAFGLLQGVTRDLLRELGRSKNRRRLARLTNSLGRFVFDNVKLYLYTIILILILGFVMNSVQFLYYLSATARPGAPP